MTCNITCMADLLLRNAIQHQVRVENITQKNDYPYILLHDKEDNE
jgi:hypothetical protein